jgi:hypothetical protein
MAEKSAKAPIKIDLTPEQTEQIRKATGKEVTAVELTPEALEERVAPGLNSNN